MFNMSNEYKIPTERNDEELILTVAKNWGIVEDNGILHIIPRNDIVQHDLEFCMCNPRIEVGGKLIVHNSYDCREYIENGQYS